MSLADIHLERSLWYCVWKLLRLRLVVFIRSFRRARRRRQIGYVVLMLLVLAALGGAFAGSWFILKFLRSPQLAELGIPVSFIPDMLVLLVSAAFLGILLTSFGVLLQALYLAGDMDFLVSAPVPIRAVFVAKLLQAILPNFSLICLFGLPVLYGLGAAHEYNLLYYPLVLIVLAALALAAAGLSSLLVMGAARLFPARRVAEVLGFIGATASLLCSQSGQFTSHAEITTEQTTQALEALARFNTPYSPLAWAGRGLVDIGQGRWLTGLLFLALTLGLSAALFGVALTSAERLYYTGWASIQVGTRRKKAARARAGRALWSAAPARRLVPAAVRGVMVKDFKVLRRDLRNMSQLVSPLIFGIIYAVALLRTGGEPPPGRGEAPAWFMQTLKSLLVYGNVGISLFVGWSLLARLAMMGFSQEGKSYWLLKTAPVSAGKLLLAKFLVAYLPTLALGWGFLLAISLVQQARLSAVLFGLAVVALCIAGAAGVNLAFGVAGANPNWENPQQMVRGPVSCLGMVASLVYMGVTLTLFFGPPIALALLRESETVGQLIGLALGGAVSLVCTFAPPLVVRRRVPCIGEM